MAGGVMRLSTALANLHQRLNAIPPVAAAARDAIAQQDLGTEAEQLARRNGTTVAPPPASSDGPETPEERRARGQAAAPALEEEAEEALRSIRSLRMGATASFSEVALGARDTLGALGELAGEFEATGYSFEDAAFGASESLYNSAADGADALSAAGEVFGQEVGLAANRVGALLDSLVQFSEGGEFASAGFDQGGDGGMTGGAITNAYAAQLLKEYIGRMRANEAYARGEGSVAARATQPALNEIGMARLEGYFEQMFSRFGRLSDLAREAMSRQAPKKRTPPRRQSRSSASSKGSMRINRRYLP